MRKMQKVIVYLLLLDLFTVTLQVSDRKEVTSPVSSPIELKGDDDLKVNNIEVTLRRSNTTCLSITPECTLTYDAIELIKGKCNKQVSCEIDMRVITNNQSCLHDYGYFNVWYTCKQTLDLSCDFEAGTCNWSPVHNKNRFRWAHGHLPTDNLFPLVDHTSASRKGKYVYIHESNSRMDDIAILESAKIVAMEQSCLSFWYYTTNYRDSVYVYRNKQKVLDLSDYEGKKWHHIIISLKKTLDYSYKLVFKVIRGRRLHIFGAIVIDDILVESNKCNYKYKFNTKMVSKNF